MKKLFLPALLTTTLGFTGAVPQAIGYYSKGLLNFASELPTEGPGFYHLFRSRDRFYGTREMVSVLTTVATLLEQTFPNEERLQIGDISAKKGGLITRHNSHQNGLDVDIAYLRNDNREQEVEYDGFDEDFLKDGEISPNFDTERNWELMKLLFHESKVNRIFVDQKIKDELCRFARDRGELETELETLRRLRPYPDHSDHLHLRLECPEGNTQCQAQELPPEGHGCNFTN